MHLVIINDNIYYYAELIIITDEFTELELKTKAALTFCIIAHGFIRNEEKMLKLINFVLFKWTQMNWNVSDRVEPAWRRSSEQERFPSCWREFSLSERLRKHLKKHETKLSINQHRNTSQTR